MILTHALLVAVFYLCCAQAKRKVAIVGAGPAGSATAYFLRQELVERQLAGTDSVEIHVFEQSGRVGGRVKSGTVEYNNQTLHFEMGASMFIGVNKHLYELSQRFNLTLCSHPCTFAHDNKQGMANNHVSWLGSYGIWDPNTSEQSGQWLVKMGNRFWADAVKALWRYRGTGTLNHIRKRTAQAVDEFLSSYGMFENGAGNSSAAKPYRSWDEYLQDKPYMQMSLYYHAIEYYLSSGERVDRRFLDEVVSIATRVNYMQDIDQLSTLGAHISMAAESDEAYSVAGGNWQVFEKMLQASGATLHLNTGVRSIQHGNDRYTVAFADNNGNKTLTDDFDTVVIAAPLPLSGIDVLGTKQQEASLVEYVQMRVTFAIGTLHPNLFPGGHIPRLIVTPYHTTSPFNCLSILACLSSDDSDDSNNSSDPKRKLSKSQRQKMCKDGPVLVKIFSHEPVPLDKVFASVKWHQEQLWHSYPKLIPRNSHYTNSDDKDLYRPHRPPVPQIVLDKRAGSDGIYYINGFEAIFSTMESQTVAARHVVQLLLHE
ncbi:hypothetical protein GGI12_001101 [Dipsacomyces acuminosporus]|nr:hypothetical protein GGI12_001101 [Dipsacomyces acuminosporus]